MEERERNKDKSGTQEGSSRRETERKKENVMRQDQSQIDRTTRGNGDIRTDRAGQSPGKKKNRLNRGIN